MPLRRSSQSQFERRNGDQVLTTHDLWGDPIPESPPPMPRRKRRQRRIAQELPTDILSWLAHNEPEQFADLMDLRRAL